MHNLLFIETDHPPAPEETQVTVRYGDKWNDRLSVGDLVNVIVCPRAHEDTCEEAGVGCEHVGYASILGVWNGSLCNIPNTLLEFEHEPVCRKWPGLKKGLEDIYGDE